MKKVIIDAGHSINTKGKSSPDCALMEWRYNREIANAIAQGLILRGYDAEVIVPELEDIPLKERVDRVNRIPASTAYPNPCSSPSTSMQPVTAPSG